MSLTKKCKSCGLEIDKASKSYLHCGKKQTRKLNRFEFFGLILFGISLITSIFGGYFGYRYPETIGITLGILFGFCVPIVIGVLFSIIFWRDNETIQELIRRWINPIDFSLIKIIR